jgi:hypothetical protein
VATHVRHNLGKATGTDRDSAGLRLSRTFSGAYPTLFIRRFRCGPGSEFLEPAG